MEKISEEELQSMREYWNNYVAENKEFVNRQMVKGLLLPYVPNLDMKEYVAWLEAGCPMDEEIK